MNLQSELSDHWVHLVNRLAILVVFVTMICGCDSLNENKRFQKSRALTSAVLSVNVIVASKQNQTIETAVFFGKLKPNRESRLGFGRGGTLKSVFKTLGDEAKAGEKIAELDQDQLQTQKTTVEAAIEELKQSAASGGEEPQGLDTQELQQLEAQRLAIEMELAHGIINAPYDCLVSNQNVDIGSLVGQQTPVVQIMEKSPIMAETDLPHEIANGLDIGQPVWVGVGNQAVQAQIKTRSPIESSFGSRSVSMEILDDMGSNWSFGQIVEIRFLTPTANSGFWVPLSALQRESNGLWSIYAVTGNDDAGQSDSEQDGLQVQRRIVDMVQLEDDWALVQGAIQEGERIIVDGSHRIVPGQSVTPVDVTDQFTSPGSGANE